MQHQVEHWDISQLQKFASLLFDFSFFCGTYPRQCHHGQSQFLLSFSCSCKTLICSPLYAELSGLLPRRLSHPLGLQRHELFFLKQGSTMRNYNIESNGLDLSEKSFALWRRKHEKLDQGYWPSSRLMTVFIAIFPEGLQGLQESTTARTVLCTNVAAVRKKLPAPGAIIQPSSSPISTSIGTTPLLVTKVLLLATA